MGETNKELTQIRRQKLGFLFLTGILISFTALITFSVMAVIIMAQASSTEMQHSFWYFWWKAVQWAAKPTDWDSASYLAAVAAISIPLLALVGIAGTDTGIERRLADSVETVLFQRIVSIVCITSSCLAWATVPQIARLHTDSFNGNSILGIALVVVNSSVVGLIPSAQLSVVQRHRREAAEAGVAALDDYLRKNNPPHPKCWTRDQGLAGWRLFVSTFIGGLISITLATLVAIPRMIYLSLRYKRHENWSALVLTTIITLIYSSALIASAMYLRAQRQAAKHANQRTDFSDYMLTSILWLTWIAIWAAVIVNNFHGSRYGLVWSLLMAFGPVAILRFFLRPREGRMQSRRKFAQYLTRGWEWRACAKLQARLSSQIDAMQNSVDPQH